MFGEVMGIYARIILQFLLELYVFYVLVMFRFNRAPRFWARLFGGLAGVAAIAFGTSFFYYYYGDTVFGRIAVYLLLFAVTTLHARLCFAEGYKTVLFGCSLAYAAQNLVYKLFLIFYCSGEYFLIFEGWGDNFSLYYRLVYYAFFIAAAAATYFLLIRRLIRRLPDCYIDFKMMAISVLVLVVTVILCSVEDVHFAEFAGERDNKFTDPDIFILRQTGNIFSVVCCAAVILLISQTLVERDLQREVEYLQYAVRQGEKQYDMTKSTMDMINIKYHDIKYKVNALLAEGSGGAQAAGELLKDISVYDANVATGNKILDVLLTEKSLYCEQNGISFTCMADGGSLDFMEDGDLYCLFGNIVDNALEAVKKLTDPEKRTISLSVRRQGGLVTIEEENYFSGSLTFEDGLPKTTKDDKAYHGFGTRSIKMIAAKYGGAMTASADGDVYSLCVILSAQVKNNDPQNR